MSTAYRCTVTSLIALVAVAGCLVIAPLGSYEAPADTNPEGAGGSSSTANSTSNTGSSGGSSGSPGSDAGGAAGQGNQGCSSNAECVTEANGSPYRCVDGACVPLATSECPLVYDAASASHNNPIYIGALVPLAQPDWEKTGVLYPYRLALDEFNAAGGVSLPSSDGKQKSRPLVMVVCDNQPGSLDASLSHLIGGVQVPAILASLLPVDLQSAYETYAQDQVFFLSPVGATQKVATLRDDDLVWTMLGQPADLVPVYQHLIADLVEPYLREVRSDIGERPIRLALLKGSDAFGLELSNLVEGALNYNGQSLEDNDSAGNFQAYTLKNDTDLTAVVSELFDFVPDLVVSTAGEEVTRFGSGILYDLETAWDAAAGTDDQLTLPRPFYVLSPFNAGDLAGVIKVFDANRQIDSEAHHRVLGVTAAGAEDTSLQNKFARDLKSAFGDELVNADTGNYYDAFYFLAHAIHASAVVTPGGLDIARGMRRLLGGTPFNVGYLDIVNVTQALEDSKTTIQLVGTLGAPEFDQDSGVRVDPGAVYCLSAPAASLVVTPNALGFERTTNTFTGNFPCFSGFVN